mgnify:CR=1 FL=1
MIKRIVSFALHQPLFIVLGTVLFIGAGIAAFKALPVEALPDVTDTQVQVITLFPGRAAEEVVYGTRTSGLIAWNDDMLFNAAKMTVEMEYQHTAVDQFARTITPNIAEFVAHALSPAKVTKAESTWAAKAAITSLP